MSSKMLIGAGSIATSIVAIVALLALTGWQVPRPAWSNDLATIRSEYTAGIKIAQAKAEDAQRMAVSQALRLNDLRTGENRQAQALYIQQGQQVPPFLRELEADLKRERRDLDARWQELIQ